MGGDGGQVPSQEVQEDGHHEGARTSAASAVAAAQSSLATATTTTTGSETSLTIPSPRGPATAATASHGRLSLETQCSEHAGSTLIRLQVSAVASGQ